MRRSFGCGPTTANVAWNQQNKGIAAARLVHFGSAFGPRQKSARSKVHVAVGGRGGMLVSSLSYGNWITHGSQIEEETAAACVKAALDEGITTFDTADVYAMGRAES